MKAKKKAEPGDIKIGRLSRGKKKSVTRITGLLTYQLDLKKTAKIFGNKFACGSSSNEKADEIVIQGPVYSKNQIKVAAKTFSLKPKPFAFE